MATTFNGYKRLTHGYTDGWSSLDEHQFVGVFKHLGTMFVTEDDEFSEVRRLYFVAPRGVSRDDAITAIRDSLSFGCRCEHDCCGHDQGLAGEVRHLKRRTYVAIQHVYRNV